MAETVITPIVAPTKFSKTGVACTMTALDNANGNKFVVTGNTLVIVQNTDSGSHSVQFTSQPDQATGRTGDINQALAAGEIRQFRFTTNGWSNGGFIFMPSGQSAFLKISVTN